MLESLRKKIANIILPVKNAVSLGNQFLKFGNSKMLPDWTQAEMSDQDFYTGYSYAAIRNRSNAVAQNGIKNVKTKSSQKDFVHPYLALITKSPTFSDYSFWSDISTYIDLEGIYYLLAVRNKEGDRFGNIKEFKMLNPYNIKRVVKFNSATGKIEIAGYVENVNGFIREIPTEMIIEMKELNPFKPQENFAMTDAAKESQFTLKTSGDYTRHALKHNINAPGIISTDVILEDQDFENFTKRIINRTKGEPVFGNGKGAITWQGMDKNLSKSGLKEINEINRDILFSVSGVSKTLMGIEQAGTTRETSKVQTALFTNNQIIPRIQLIIDSLNQDFLNNSPKNSQKDARIIVNNPTTIDHEADIKRTESLQSESDLYNELLELGYDANKSASFVNGEIGVEELGEPTPPEPDPEPAKPTEEQVKEKHDHKHDDQKKNKVEVAKEDKGLVSAQQASLQNAIVNIDQQLLLESIKKISKTLNKINVQADIIGIRAKKRIINELQLILTGFYGIITTLEGGSVMRKRISKFALPGTFTLDRITKRNIKSLAKKVSESHVDTVLDDIFETARKEALAGGGIDQVSRALRKKYTEVISTTRAKTIARTETNRAFTQAQFEADRQFIKQNKLESRAFKQWVTRSDDPCPFCLELESRKPIPFDQAFKDLGSELVVDGKVLPINFEPLDAGNAHPNCSCIYELIIITDENQIKKSLEELAKIDKDKKQAKKELKQINDELKSIEETL